MIVVIYLIVLLLLFYIVETVDKEKKGRSPRSSNHNDIKGS